MSVISNSTSKFGRNRVFGLIGVVFSALLVAMALNSLSVSAQSGDSGCAGQVSDDIDAAQAAFGRDCGQSYDDQKFHQCTWVSDPQGWICHEKSWSGVASAPVATIGPAAQNVAGSDGDGPASTPAATPEASQPTDVTSPAQPDPAVAVNAVTGVYAELPPGSSTAVLGWHQTNDDAIGWLLYRNGEDWQILEAGQGTKDEIFDYKADGASTYQVQPVIIDGEYYVLGPKSIVAAPRLSRTIGKDSWVHVKGKDPVSDELARSANDAVDAFHAQKNVANEALRNFESALEASATQGDQTQAVAAGNGAGEQLTELDLAGDEVVVRMARFDECIATDCGADNRKPAPAWAGNGGGNGSETNQVDAPSRPETSGF